MFALDWVSDGISMLVFEHVLVLKLGIFFVAKGDVTIIMTDDDMVNLMLGKLNPQQVWLK